MPPEPVNNNLVANPLTNNPSVLDQPVPNPLAKNPNFFTHKVFAAIGIILVVTVAVLFGLALIYHVNLADLFNTTPANDSTKVGTSSAVPSGNNDWNTYTNTTVGYTINYPKNWVSSSTSEEKDCGVRFGLSKEQLGTCVPGNGNLLQLGLVTIQVVNDSLTNQVNNYKKITSLTQSNTKVGGKTAVKITGTQNDNKEIVYLVDLSGSVLSIEFYAWPQNSANYSSDFEKMVLTIKFDETVGWKTYSSTDLGVSFSYPNSWVITKATTPSYYIATDNPDNWDLNNYTEITIKSPDFGQVVEGTEGGKATTTGTNIKIYIYWNKLSFSSFDDVSFLKTSSKDATFGNLKAKIVETTNNTTSNSSSYYLLKNSKLFVISREYPTGKKDVYEKDFQSFISTFKFL